MKLEQCDKAPDHLRCVRLKGHEGPCDNVSATAFNNVLQAAEEQFLYGNQLPKSPNWPKAKRIESGEFLTEAFMRDVTLCEPVNPRVTYSDTPQPRLSDDAQDELGKVWDALHAAGISGEGKMSASEGVTLLAIRMNGGEQISKPSICDKCGGCGWEQPDVAIEQCSKCGGAGIVQ